MRSTDYFAFTLSVRTPSCQSMRASPETVVWRFLDCDIRQSRLNGTVPTSARWNKVVAGATGDQGTKCSPPSEVQSSKTSACGLDEGDPKACFARGKPGARGFVRVHAGFSCCGNQSAVALQRAGRRSTGTRHRPKSGPRTRYGPRHRFYGAGTPGPSGPMVEAVSRGTGTGNPARIVHAESR